MASGGIHLVRPRIRANECEIGGLGIEGNSHIRYAPLLIIRVAATA